MNKPKGYKNFLFTGIVIFLLLFFQEVLFRSFFPLPEISNFNRIQYTSLDDALGSHQGMLMNYSYLWISDPDEASFVSSLNLYGFRDPIDWKVKKDPSVIRVMFIGDSYVEGLMAADHQTIPRIFQDALPKDRRYEVMNLGIAGNQPIQYFKLIADAVPLFHPDVIFMVFYANDFPPDPYDSSWLESKKTPAYYEEWVPRIVNVFARWANHETIARPWHAQAFPFFPPVPNPTNPLSKASPESLRFVDPKLLSAMKQGRFNPYLVGHLDDCESMLKRPFDFDPHLAALKAFLARFSTKLYLAYVPHPMQASDYYIQFERQYSQNKSISSLMDKDYQVDAAILAKSAAQNDIPFLDLTPSLRDEELKGRRLYWNYDNHMKAAGYSHVGQKLAEWYERLE